jgi:hypothetical protein
LVVDENLTAAGYNPPRTFIKPDQNEIKSYCGPLHRFERSAAFTIGGGVLTFDSTILRAAGSFLIEGQGALLTLKDGDNSGFMGIEFRNNGNALRGWLRHTTADGTIDVMIDVAQTFTFGPTQHISRKNLRILGQAATLDIWDSDSSGFTYINFSNNGGAALGSIRHTTSSGLLEFTIAGTAKLGVGAGGVMASLPVYADNAAAVAGSLPLEWLYRTTTGEVRIRV